MTTPKWTWSKNLGLRVMRTAPRTLSERELTARKAAQRALNQSLRECRRLCPHVKPKDRNNIMLQVQSSLIALHWHHPPRGRR